MKVKLYKPFEHWYHGGTLWIVSDTHFEDSDCKLMDPNWISPEEQVKLINSCVGKNDTLIHLGDVGNVEWIKKLKGYKVLITGNHDAGVSNYKKKYSVYSRTKNKTLYEYDNYKEAEDLFNELVEDGRYIEDDLRINDNRLFDEIYDGPLFINEKILLSHEAVNLNFGINIHGHDHAGKHLTIENGKYARINMAANVVNYKPERIDKLVNGLGVIDIHRLTVDNAKVNPLHKKS